MIRALFTLLKVLPSSAQAPAKPSWAELALFLANPATHPHRESLFYSQ